jgi:hypothetical protein
MQNRWAGHLIPDIDRFILPGRGTLGVVKAPEGFLGMTGAQHWNDTINVSTLHLGPKLPLINTVGVHSLM